MRDMNRVRDKIEIRLEPRQIALLVVATMVFSGGLFGGGYYLGQRSAPAPAPEANLATIDAATAEVAPAAEATPPTPAALGEVEFLFPSLLGSRPARKTRATRRSRPVSPSAPTTQPAPVAVKAPPPAVVIEKPTPVAVAPEPPEPEVVIEKSAPVAVAPEPAEPEVVIEKPAPVAVAPEPPEPEVVIERSAPVVVAPEPPEPEVVEKPAPAAPPVVVLSAAPRPAAMAPEPPEPEVRVDEDAPPVAAKPKYTLQVKALRTRAEVDEFSATVRALGYKPSVILANVPGKGRVYRVRLGRFTDRAEARRFQREFKRRSKLPDGGFVTDL